jgi:hypothetical protein
VDGWTDLVEFFGFFVDGVEEGGVFFGLLRLELLEVFLGLRHGGRFEGGLSEDV